MTSIDNAGIAIAIGVLVILLAVAATLSAAQDAGPVVTAPTISKTVEKEVQVESTTSVEDKAAMDLEDRAEAKAEAMEAEAEAKAAMEAEAEAKAAMEAEAEAKAAMEAEAEPQTHVVDVPIGTSVPGCEETNACFSPADIIINAGDTVSWDNVDTAAHTVTSGSPADGPSGVFDSSLLMASAAYAFTFEDAGNYDYFCMVHPWMVGTVSVN
jgi:plastocyanin